jgi:hypothetical protein
VNQRINPRNDACQNDTAGEVPPVIGGPDKVGGIGQQVRTGDPGLFRCEWVGQELGVGHELIQHGRAFNWIRGGPEETAGMDTHWTWITPKPPAGPSRGNLIEYPPNFFTTSCRSQTPYTSWSRISPPGFIFGIRAIISRVTCGLV